MFAVNFWLRNQPTYGTRCCDSGDLLATLCKIIESGTASRVLVFSGETGSILLRFDCC